MLIFNSKFFDKGLNLSCDKDKLVWTNDVPANGIFVEGTNGTFYEIANVMGHKVNKFIPEEYKVMAKSLKVSPPWFHFIGKEKFLGMVKVYREEYSRFIDNNEESNILIQIEISEFLKKMKPCKYDVSKVLLEKSKINTHIVPFLYIDNLMAPSYNRLRTKTGRLVVSGGPNVLTMNAEFRKGIVDGYNIDFISMEPNFLLAIQDIEPKDNLYETIIKDVFNGKLSRVKAKIAVMSALYGSNRNDKNSKLISEYFNIDSVIKGLELQIDGDSIKNVYGRKIELQGARGRHMLSLWLQSSASEAALLGFGKLERDYDINPHWIIHDGMMFTFNGDITLPKEIDVGIKYPLPLKVEKI